jgi:hypothetical protein
LAQTVEPLGWHEDCRQSCEAPQQTLLPQHVAPAAASQQPFPQRLASAQHRPATHTSAAAQQAWFSTGPHCGRLRGGGMEGARHAAAHGLWPKQGGNGTAGTRASALQAAGHARRLEACEGAGAAPMPAPR